MMEYRRQIGIKLLLLRGSLVLLGGLSWLSFYEEKSNLGYFLAVALFFMAFIKVTGLRITKERIRVVRYIIYGLVPLRMELTKGDASTRLDLMDETGANSLTQIGEPVELIFVFFPIKAKFRGMWLVNNPPGRRERQMAVTLNAQEYEMIETRFIKEQHPAPTIFPTTNPIHD
jgi:hypothetical protein